MSEQETVRICDCFPQLREVTARRERSYRSSPDASMPVGPQTELRVKVTSTGELNERAESLLTGRQWEISEPKFVGGRDDAPYPLEYLLSGAVGCFAAVFAFYAAKYQVEYESFEVIAVADLDVSGHMIEDAPPAGFKTVRMDIVLTGALDVGAIDRVHQAALAGCPGIATLRNPVTIESAVKGATGRDIGM